MEGAPQLVVRALFETPDRYDSLRTWLMEEFRKPETEQAPDARAIFAELRAESGGPRRQLLESEAFRALLLEDALAEAA